MKRWNGSLIINIWKVDGENPKKRLLQRNQNSLREEVKFVSLIRETVRKIKSNCFLNTYSSGFQLQCASRLPEAPLGKTIVTIIYVLTIWCSPYFVRLPEWCTFSRNFYGNKFLFWYRTETARQQSPRTGLDAAPVSCTKNFQASNAYHRQSST